MNAFIYTGGECDYTNIAEKPAADDLVIAADSGWRHATALRVKPSVLLGDFDSLDGGNGIPDDVPDDVEILTVPAEKDFTDTQMAVDEARKRGAKHITIIGGLGGRLDHTLSCLAILEDLWEKGDRLAVIDSGYSRVRFLSSDSALIPRSGYKYLSLLAVDPVVKGVEIDLGEHGIGQNHPPILHHGGGGSIAAGFNGQNADVLLFPQPGPRCLRGFLIAHVTNPSE